VRCVACQTDALPDLASSRRISGLEDTIDIDASGAATDIDGVAARGFDPRPRRPEACENTNMNVLRYLTCVMYLAFLTSANALIPYHRYALLYFAQHNMMIFTIRMIC
jgi:hypothetical protein